MNTISISMIIFCIKRHYLGLSNDTLTYRIGLVFVEKFVFELEITKHVDSFERHCIFTKT
jgi:hypothetical protein